MYDIMFDVELNKIKKRYGNIVSFNINQTCGFMFMNDEFVGNKSVAAIFSRKDKEFAIELTKDKEEYTCRFPDELCDSAEAYKLTLIAFTNDADAPSDFRSTVAYYGTIEESGCSGTDFAPKHSETIFDKVGDEYRIDLAESLGTATGEVQDGKTWDELNETVAGLPVLKEEQTQALGDWDLIKEYFKNCTSASSGLFVTAPKDENGNNMYYKLPYIYTPRMTWNQNGGSISPYLTEAGIDITSAKLFGSTSGASPFAAKGIQKWTITGNANAPSLQSFMSGSSSLVYIKMETASETALGNMSNYYWGAFRNCTSLQTIDCELDLTGQSNVNLMFDNCYKLKHLRIKPFTLSTSLNLGTCRSLHHNDLGDYDSLISILNSITLDRDIAKNITITFSNEITDFTTDGGFWNCKVWPQNDGSYTEEEGDTMFAHPITLYEAFINKGVTIAWQ